MTRRIEVTGCGSCPCRKPRRELGPWRSTCGVTGHTVATHEVVPGNCPLRAGDVVVTLRRQREEG